MPRPGSLSHDRQCVGRCLERLREAEAALDAVRTALADLTCQAACGEEDPAHPKGEDAAGGGTGPEEAASPTVASRPPRPYVRAPPEAADPDPPSEQELGKVAWGTPVKVKEENGHEKHVLNPLALAEPSKVEETCLVDQIIVSTIGARMRSPNRTFRSRSLYDSEACARLPPRAAGSTATAPRQPFLQAGETDSEPLGPSRSSAKLLRSATVTLSEKLTSLNTNTTAAEDGEKVEFLDCTMQTVFPQHPRLKWLRVPIFHPEARFKMFWNIVGSLFILYELFALPVYVAFDVQVEGQFFAWVSVVNAYFLTDIVLHFMYGYMDANGRVIVAPLKVLRLYASTWLVPDLVASIPWEWIPTQTAGNREHVTRSVRVMRAFRMLRLMRLMRVLKMGHILAIVEARVETNHVFLFALGIVRIALLLVAVCHWSACVWYAIGTGSYYAVEYEGGEAASWVIAYQDTYPYIGDEKLHHYVYAFYYCLTTMTTVGYGDITPRNFDEVRFAMVLLAISCVLFASLMGTLTDMLTAFNSRRRALAEKKVMLSRYMRFRAVPWKLMMRIRFHLVFLWEANQGYDAYEDELKVLLSPVLREELYHHIYGQVLTSAPFLAWMRDYPTCAKFLAEKVRSVFLTPGDCVVRMGEAQTHIYMLLAGQVIVSRIEHLLERDHDPIFRKDSGVLTLDIPRSNESKMGNMPYQARAKFRRRYGVLRTGLDTFDSDVLDAATTVLRINDIRERHAARRVQRMWRQRVLENPPQEVKETEGYLDSQSLRIERMYRRHMSAPAYFGESCLWQALEEWGVSPPPTYLYTVRCESRGEIINIPRDAVQELLARFSPWLPERLAIFRQAVLRELGFMMADDEAFKQMARDWVSPD